MNNILFASNDHEKFFFFMMGEVRVKDCYHRAFFYAAGISKDTRDHIQDIFDFDNDCIKPDGLYQGWQTGGSMRLTRLAFNLWNGYVEEGNERLSCPYELFDCGYAPYFWESIRWRYPEYCLSDNMPC